jgi:hypothetical protein
MDLGYLDNSYKAQLQALNAKRKAQLQGISEEADTSNINAQNDRNKIEVTNAQNKTNIRNMMGKYNIAGGGQNLQMEMDSNNNRSNNLANVDVTQNQYLKGLYNRTQNTNNEFDAQESSLLADTEAQKATINREELARQQASSQASSSSQDKTNQKSELNSIYAELYSQSDNGNGEQFLTQNRQALIEKYGNSVYADMMKTFQGYQSTANANNRKKETYDRMSMLN